MGSPRPCTLGPWGISVPSLHGPPLTLGSSHSGSFPGSWLLPHRELCGSRFLCLEFAFLFLYLVIFYPSFKSPLKCHFPREASAACNLGQAIPFHIPMSPGAVPVVTDSMLSHSPGPVMQPRTRSVLKHIWMNEPSAAGSRGPGELSQGHTASLWQCGRWKQECCQGLFPSPNGGHPLPLSASDVYVYVLKDLFRAMC